jgi:hypothetical protein
MFRTGLPGKPLSRRKSNLTPLFFPRMVGLTRKTVYKAIKRDEITSAVA